MRFRYTIFYVDSVPETLAFYEKAFGLSRGFLHESEDYGELDTGAVTLSFSSRELMTSLGKPTLEHNPKNPVFEISLETDDVKAALARALEAGARLEQDVRDEEWGQTTSYVSDPNGFLIAICSPVQIPG